MTDELRAPGVVCAGGAVLDRHLHLVAPPVPGTSNPARASSSAGGVARNVAENLALLGARVRLVSRVGDDDAGRELLVALRRREVDVSGVTVAVGEATAQYVAVLDPGGDLVLGVAAMDVLDGITPADLDAAWPAPGEWLLADCNLPVSVLAAVLDRARADGTRVAVEAVSTPKVVRLAAAGGLRGVRVLFCNLDEARALLAALDGAPDGEPVTSASALVAAGAATVVLTLGPAGALAADATGVRAVPAVPAEVVDVTGAGDALVAATVDRLARGASLDDAVRVGVAAAALALAGLASVRPDLGEQLQAL